MTLPNVRSLSAGPLDEADAERCATFLKALADPSRLQILSHLAADGGGPLAVAELAERVRLSQPTVSHHLKRMADVGLLERSREGRAVMHVVRPETFAELRTILQVD